MSTVVIEARTGKTVRELWEEGGEPAYRHLESQVVLEMLPGTTRSCWPRPAGRSSIPPSAPRSAPAFVVWLRAEPATLAARVAPDDHRPLLGDRPPRC